MLWIYVQDYWEGDVMKRDHDGWWKVVEGPWNGGVNFHRNKYCICSSLARRPRAARWPRNELLARLVGEEAPHELMRDGGEPPICGSLRPDHRGEVRATHNFSRKEKAGKRCGRGQSWQRSQEERNQKGSGKIYRGIDKQRRRRVTFVLNFWQIETQSHSIVVQAQGWLVVNPFRIAEPTVGWKRAPLSAVASNLVFFQ